MRTTVIAILCACGSTAHAEIIHFVNPAPGQPGHYDWHWEDATDWRSWLDITRGPADQPNVLNGNSVGQLGVWFAPGGNVTTSWPGVPAADVAVDSENYTQFLTLALSEGAPLAGHAYMSQSHHFNPMWPGEPLSLFPEGERRFIGVRTNAFNYGWIEVERTGGSFAAFSWAFETVAGVPIAAGQVPEPGAAVLLGAGVFAACRRRRS